MALTIEEILLGHGIGLGGGIDIVKSDTEPTTNLSEGLFWYNTTSKKMKMYVNGEFSDIGGGGGHFFSTFPGRVRTTDPTATINIPVSQYNPSTDALIVYKNSVYIPEGEMYTLDKINKRIMKVTGVWDATTFDFVVIAPTTTPNTDTLMLVKIEDHVTVVAGVTTVTFTIPAYNSETDILEVHQRNLPIYKDINWTLGYDKTSIVLTEALLEDDEFHFTVYKKIRDIVPEGVIDGSVQILDGSITQPKFNKDVFDLIEKVRRNNEMGYIKKNKDANGIFIVIEESYNGKLITKSTLSSANSDGNYLVRTVEEFGEDNTVSKTIIFDITYDADGDILSETKRA